MFLKFVAILYFREQFNSTVFGDACWVWSSLGPQESALTMLSCCAGLIGSEEIHPGQEAAQAGSQGLSGLCLCEAPCTLGAWADTWADLWTGSRVDRKPCRRDLGGSWALMSRLVICAWFNLTFSCIIISSEWYCHSPLLISLTIWVDI